MSIQAMAWVLEHSQAKLGDRLVALAIASHADAQGRCWPSHPMIARESRLHERQVYRSVQRLVELGELQIVGSGFRGVNVYELRMNDSATPDNLSPVNTAGVSPTTPDKSCATPDKSDTDPCSPVRETLIEPSREPSREDSSSLRSDFAEWYSAFPRHVGRDDAWKAYLRARRKTSKAELLAAIERYRAGKADYADWAHPATWLNKGRWLDEYGGESNGSRPDRPQGPPPPLTPEQQQMLDEIRREEGVH